MKKIARLLLPIIFVTIAIKGNAQTILHKNTNIDIERVEVIPCYTLTENNSVCNGTDYTFPDGTIQTITAQVVHISNLLTVVTQCDSIIETTVNVLPSYNRSETFFNICSGVDYTFPDGTVQHILAHTEYTSYLQTVGSLCDSIIHTTLNTTDVDFTVMVSGNTLTAIQTNAGYQWLDCDNAFAPIDGEMGQSFSAIAGNFAVIIFKGNCIDTSDCHQIGLVGIQDVNSNTISLFPNPTTGIFKVNLGSTQSEVNVIIRNVVGQQIQSLKLSKVSLVDLLIENAPGIYFLEVQVSDRLQATFKVIKE